VDRSRRAIDRQILSLAIPALGALAVEPLYVAVDTAIIGRVGTSELAGLAGAGTVLSLVIAGCNFLAYGTTERVARARGTGDLARARLVATQALWVALALSAIAVPLLAVLSEPLVALLGLRGDAAFHSVRYLRIALLGIPAVLMAIAAQGVLRGIGDYRRPLWILLLGNSVNVVLEVPMVLIWNMSMTGSALSTVISQYLVAMCFWPILRPHLAPPGSRRPAREVMQSLLAVGGNLALRVGAMLVVLTGATVLAARSGETDLAAHQIVVGVFMLLALALDALAVPAHTLIGQLMGAADISLARLIAQRVVVLSAMTGSLLAVALIACSGPISRLFSADQAVSGAAVGGLVVLGTVLLPGALAFAGDGVLIGAGDHRFLGRAAVVQALVLIPIVLVPGIGAGPGVTSVWILLGCWMVVRASTVMLRMKAVLHASHIG
jgi:putative MATE family efflux protein